MKRSRHPGSGHRRRLLVVLTSMSLALSACGSGGATDLTDDGGSAGTAVTPTVTPTTPGQTAGGSPSAATAPSDAGPRAIPAAVVNLEVAGFPRPASEACADNTIVVDVATDASIAAAVAAAQPGTTIRVAAGTYVEQPDEWLALAVDSDDVCLRSSGGDVVLEAAGSDQKLGIVISGDDIAIEGFVIRGFEVGVAVEGPGGETQRGVTIEGTRIEDPVGEFREGVVVYTEEVGSGPVLDGLLLLDVVVEGIDLGVSCNVGPCEHVWVESTRIAGRAESETSGADAFAIEEGRQIVVVDSVVTGVAADGIDTKADDVVVFGCRVFDVGRNGIKLWRGGDVINSIVDGTDADAALVGEEPGTYRYIHSVVAHHGEPGGDGYVGTWSYDVRSSDIAVEIVNSIFFDNSSGGLFIPDGATMSIRHTIFTGGSGDQLLDVGGDLSFLLADLDALESAGFGVGNVVADPAFVDIAGHDYATDVASPARDAAEDIPGLDVDAVGGPRARGTAADIGPVES